jgi:hypothetical protein
MEDGRIIKEVEIEQKKTSFEDDRTTESSTEESTGKSADDVKGQTAHVEGWTTGAVKGSMYTT